ncbi:ATP-dependent DNA helicase RecG [Lacihabitans sp. LS3-19]|uniref:ATP-dependent DNA helicase RecG n=1 Tax=Lacihabitans sp. LS3-19 TaxID=2487335 RepID=UPI0020CC17D6|nr:ATP-dependent DNA helicase RecG [Lacihabitans sp. LS3-19]MCP9767784.1 ATP-dependent DNA helicase RecG [Lacihabitans sp. LS3-19]
MSSFFETKIELLRGVNAQKAEWLNKELGIFTFADLIEYYPFRHEDRTQFHKISEISEDMFAAQIIGRIVSVELVGGTGKQRLVATFRDGTSHMELVWFQSISYFQKFLKPNAEYVIYGKPVWFGGNFSITHPEIDLLTANNNKKGYFQSIYSLTEKLRKQYIDSKTISIWIKNLLDIADPYINETIPASLCAKYRLIPKNYALRWLHVPRSFEELHQAQRRLKFEELFYNQLRLIKLSLVRKNDYAGQVFQKTTLLTEFYTNHLPFDLTNAQKRVVKEIFEDLKSGKQMNRLIQGDVGSGKTIVAFISMLMAIDGGAQACMMAPTEILAQQHYVNLKKFGELLGVRIEILTGSSKKKDRTVIHEALLSGDLKILVGTHALLEDIVQFKNLGLVVIDEQHRFGVAQRAKLWEKNKVFYPHMMVMTATPIPRTLAMTLFGDLDHSEIDEMPPGRKPIVTVHRYDANRLKVFEFMRDELKKGRQIYIVYPLIEESEKLDLKNLYDGYESIERAFPGVPLSIVHGKMKPKDKEYEMQRFKKGETKLMVATTVIEVGVDVPNASVMVIESAQRFGLSQLHQLRGRVGRGADQSFCILMTDYKLSKDTQKRLNTMVQTENGFLISQVDLELRGPGDMSGTQQSGLVDLKIANLAKDEQILKIAREEAFRILKQDPNLEMADHLPIKLHIDKIKNKELSWNRIS